LADVDEHVLPALVPLDEPEALLGIEEFDFALGGTDHLRGHAAAPRGTAVAAEAAAARTATETVAAAEAVTAATETVAATEAIIAEPRRTAFGEGIEAILA